MGFMDEFNFWLSDDYFDQATKDELSKIKDNESEIEERFYKELEFGTGGLRGVIGAGITLTVIKSMACKLYHQGKRTEKRDCHRLRFAFHVPGVCG